MRIKNQSKAWGKSHINVVHLSGLMIAYGGLKYGIRGLVDDYLESYRALRIPALLNNRTGKMIEDLYDDLLSMGLIYPMDDHKFRDVAHYLLDALDMEKIGRSILTFWESQEEETIREARNVYLSA